MAKASQALAAAKLLLDAKSPDGACNRAYYAMFDAARAPPPRHRSRSGEDPSRSVLSDFGRYLVKNGPISKEMSTKLRAAETFRYTADYHDQPVDPADAEGIVKHAQDSFTAIQKLLADEEPNLRV